MTDWADEWAEEHMGTHPAHEMDRRALAELLRAAYQKGRDDQYFASEVEGK